jgi:hypothetical protein
MGTRNMQSSLHVGKDANRRTQMHNNAPAHTDKFHTRTCTRMHTRTRIVCKARFTHEHERTARARRSTVFSATAAAARFSDREQDGLGRSGGPAEERNARKQSRRPPTMRRNCIYASFDTAPERYPAAANRAEVNERGRVVEWQFFFREPS